MILYLILTAGFFGLLVGSFLNVVIYRLPISLMNSWRAECTTFLADDASGDAKNLNNNDSEDISTGSSFNIAYPRSHCPSCKTLIPSWYNIPVLSYLLLKGRCHACSIKISLRYPFIELISALATGFVVYRFGLTVETAALILFSWALICLTFIDIDHQLLPDQMTLPLLWTGLILNAYGGFTDLHSALYGAIFGYLSLWSIYWVFKLITGKEGMGYGDFKLLAALGAWLGWQQLPTIILLSSVVGAVIGISSIVISGKDKNKPIPFGPYLAIAGWIACFWGETITARYYAWLI